MEFVICHLLFIHVLTDSFNF